jgi:hypothetical protein
VNLLVIHIVRLRFGHRWKSPEAVAGRPIGGSGQGLFMVFSFRSLKR